MKPTNFFAASLAIISALAGLTVASPGAVFDHTVPRRKTDGFKQAVFRLWLPDASGPVRGVVIDSTAGAKAFFDAPEWQEFASRHQMAMLTEFVSGDTVSNRDGYENGPIAEPPFTQALEALAATSKHPELTFVPLLPFGRCVATEGGFFPWRKTTSPRDQPTGGRICGDGVVWDRPGLGQRAGQCNATRHPRTLGNTR
jgi:hypothetical protein